MMSPWGFQLRSDYELTHSMLGETKQYFLDIDMQVKLKLLTFQNCIHFMNIKVLVILAALTKTDGETRMVEVHYKNTTLASSTIDTCFFRDIPIILQPRKIVKT